jgi:hypothetical protein
MKLKQFGMDLLRDQIHSLINGMPSNVGFHTHLTASQTYGSSSKLAELILEYVQLLFEEVFAVVGLR